MGNDRPTPAPDDIVFYGILGPDTWGCLDIHDHDTPGRHLCEGTIGVVGEQPEGYDEDDGPPEARWRIGNRVRMVRSGQPDGPYPYCMAIGEFVVLTAENDWGSQLHLWQPERGQNPTFFSWHPLSDKPTASFQWKGTTIDLTFTCSECESALHVVAEFAYHVACPQCRTCFAVDWNVPVERIAGLPEPG